MIFYRTNNWNQIRISKKPNDSKHCTARKTQRRSFCGSFKTHLKSRIIASRRNIRNRSNEIGFLRCCLRNPIHISFELIFITRDMLKFRIFFEYVRRIVVVRITADDANSTLIISESSKKPACSRAQR